MKKIIFTVAILLNVVYANAQVKPQIGLWRGTFAVAGGNEVPFNFELTNKDVYLLNATERFELKNYQIKGDSLFIHVELFDAVLAAKIENNGLLTGKFKKLNTATPDAGIPFKAEVGKEYRFFEKPQEAKVSLQGNWDFLIGSSGTKTVGVFNQTGSKLTGTILEVN